MQERFLRNIIFKFGGKQMKLSKEAMQVFVESFQNAIVYQTDISWMLREVDLVKGEEDGNKVLVLSKKFRKKLEEMKSTREKDIEVVNELEN